MCANYRGITLLSLPGKVYSKVLERRVRPIVEPQIEEEQRGFRPGRGTTDQLFTLAGILEGAWEYNLPVHMCLVVSDWSWQKTMKLRVQAAEMGFLRRVAGVSLRDRVRSSAIREGLGVEPLLLCVERSQLRWFGHLMRMPPGRLPREVFLARPTGRRPRGRPRTRWRDYISSLAWERLGIPQSELADVAGEREVWGSLLKLLPPRPNFG